MSGNGGSSDCVIDLSRPPTNYVKIMGNQDRRTKIVISSAKKYSKTFKKFFF
jgi:hypothetical protein